MVGGRGVRLAEESAVVTAELFVCVDLDAGRRGERAEALVRQASAIERDWLPARELRREVAISFDEERGRVTGVERVLYRDLVLDERHVAIDDEEEAARVLAEAAASMLERACDLDAADVAALRARVAFLREHMPELELPALDDDALREMLPDLCAGRRSFDELRRAPLADFLRARLEHAQQRDLDRHAPERLLVPSGSRVRLLYQAGRPPVLAARIQELFGLAETPRLAGGRVGVLVHLLAPSGRPQQITDDLASFWNTTYKEVRKELRRRYPKHAWPEDPWNAPAERRPSRRGRLK
jgi:ATP-dependent helicase HrpB